MITITETKELYLFSELEEHAKSVAINDTIEAWVECSGIVPNKALEGYNEAIRMSEEMLTPWFFGSYIWEYCKEYILAECNDGYYLKDGKFYIYISEVQDK